jgi:hypothetical protein
VDVALRDLRIDHVDFQAGVRRELLLRCQEAERRVVEVDAEDRRRGRASGRELERGGAVSQDAERLVAADDPRAARELPAGRPRLEVASGREEVRALVAERREVGGDLGIDAALLGRGRLVGLDGLIRQAGVVGARDRRGDVRRGDVGRGRIRGAGRRRAERADEPRRDKRGQAHANWHVKFPQNHP